MIAATFLCLMTPPAYAHDADTIRCADGTRIRVAGIQAPDFESAEPCVTGKPGYVCSDARARASRDIARKIVGGQTLRCRQLGKSWERVVADCTLPSGENLSCRLISAGAAVRWDSYWRRYRMRRC